MFHFASTDSFFMTSKSFANSRRSSICSLPYVKLAFDYFFLYRCKVHFKKYHIMIAYSRDYPTIVYNIVVVCQH